MALLITTKTGFISAVAEPQFQSFGNGMMVTLQFSEYDDVRDMKKYLKGDILFDQHSQMFPFTSFIHLEDLSAHFPKKKLWSQLKDHTIDFSKPPVAYWWEAWSRNEDLPEGQEPDENFYFGYSLPEEAEDLKWSFEFYPDVLNVYPLYEIPRELTKPAEHEDTNGLFA